MNGDMVFIYRDHIAIIVIASMVIGFMIGHRMGKSEARREANKERQEWLRANKNYPLTKQSKEK